MNFHEIVRTLRKEGLPLATAQNLAQTIKRKEDARVLQTSARDWDRLMAPLDRDIHSKASTMFRWREDPIRGPVYGPYLDMLRRVRNIIQQARTLNKDDKSIPEIAREKSLSGSGMHWSDWVPRKVHGAFLLAFEQMNTHPDRPRIGKRAIPFSTAMERSASDVRWDNLITSMLLEIEARKPTARSRGAAITEADSMAVLFNAVEEALDIAYKRGITDVAPVKWEHLLSKERQAELNHWYETSVRGLRDPASFDAAGQALQAKAVASLEERNAGQRERYAKRREAIRAELAQGEVQ